MAKNQYCFALEDDLFKALDDFNKGKGFDKKLIKTLLSYRISGLSFVYNTSQAKRCGIQMEAQLESQLRKASLTTQSLTDLAKRTVYKGILSTTNDTFPFININSGKIKPTISGTYYSNESRANAISHIKSLCEKAEEITVIDPYLTKTPSALDVLCGLLPSRKLKIILHDSPSNGYDPRKVQTELQSFNTLWTIELKSLLAYSHHDRYISIDSEMEVVISSGLDNMSCTTKDVTYLVKQAHPLCM